MPDHGRFVFLDEWRLAAAPEVVWPVLTDLETWPQWWPSVRRVARVADDSGSDQWEFHFRTRLPYDMEFRAEVRRDDDALTGSATVTGRLAGEATWQGEPVDGGTLVRFDWEVRPQPAWMRAVSPLARPVFSWNHRSLMAEAAFGLARRLDAGLLASPVAVLLPG
ncbi:MAG TPA: SRPBCC family protein [Propionibacteriaceae bacterium]|nr:SRPBCC family protein [Propionibacteriaceae bacterium]